jgi:hypothetical protein
MGFRLKAVGGKDAGAELAFDQPAVSIGRSSQCELVVSDPEVSRRHAEIVRVEDAYFLQDLQSSNGTQVNGTAIGRAKLSTGDELALGSARFRFSVAGATTDRTFPDAGPAPSASSTGLVPLRGPPAARSLAQRASAGARAAAGALASLWSRASRPTRLLIAVGAASAIFGFLATVSQRSSPPVRVGAEPTALTRTAIEESFGLGVGVTYPHPDAKAFDFEFRTPGTAVVVLHFQSRDISEGEVVVHVNGAHLGAVPADLIDVEGVFHQMAIRSELLKNGEPNRISFKSTRNPPRADPWRIWNLWVETIALPQLPQGPLLHEASAIFRRAEQTFARREIAASNRYTAWKDFRSVWLTLEALPDPKPELSSRAQDRMREAQRELDRLCANLMLQLQRSYVLKDGGAARDALDEIKNYFPGPDHPCPWKAEQRRAQL